MSEIFSLSGKTVLVTGASSGFGYHFAGVLAEAGARVVLGARRVDKIQARVDELAKAGHEVLGIPLDVRDPDSAQQFLASAGGALRERGRAH
jgi:NADP-dependent 3-hydroxy acid dehydrogenase YdfG